MTGTGAAEYDPGSSCVQMVRIMVISACCGLLQLPSLPLMVIFRVIGSREYVSAWEHIKTRIDIT